MPAQVEGNDQPLALRCAVADQRGVAARTERQRQGVEQDRLAGAGLAGQHVEAGRDLEVGIVDDPEVADAKLG